VDCEGSHGGFDWALCGEGLMVCLWEAYGEGKGLAMKVADWNLQGLWFWNG
jgi:hypothetical protein